MPFSILDLVVLGIVMISALLAAVRGVTREVLAIVAWVVAAAVAWTLHPMLLPTVKQHVSSDTVALVASIAAIGFAVLTVFALPRVRGWRGRVPLLAMAAVVLLMTGSVVG